MSAPSHGYESLSFGAEIQYVVDESESVKKRGKYSTYHKGSDLMTDDRYFSFPLSAADVDTLKNGINLKMAGKWGGGWKTESLDLTGFTNAYSAMCD